MRPILQPFSLTAGTEVYDTFPWKDSEFPGTPGSPLLDRVRKFAWDRTRARVGREPFRPLILPRISPAEPRTNWPARPPSSPAECIDLGPWYNGHLETDWAANDLFIHIENDLREFPSGQVSLDGIDWDVRGVVTLGEPSAPGTRIWPAGNSVTDIRIQRSARKLHFLHALWEPGTLHPKVGRYCIHYVDGSVAEIPIENGVEAGDFMISSWGRKTSRARLAWEGSNPVTRMFGTKVGLYHFAWDNPRPDVDIVSMDFERTGSPGVPFLLALTVEP
jgi:hypothetical protein